MILKIPFFFENLFQLLLSRGHFDHAGRPVNQAGPTQFRSDIRGEIQPDMARMIGGESSARCEIRGEFQRALFGSRSADVVFAQNVLSATF